jgi:putative membrane protein (TIGR04086 family)
MNGQLRELGVGVGVGLGAALAVSLPAALVAQIIDALRDDDLPSAVTVPLAVVVLAGAVVGGAVVGRRRPGRHLVVAALVGVVALGVLVGLGTLRQSAAGEDVRLLVVPVAMTWGAVLGVLGGALGARRAGRTRR